MKLCDLKGIGEKTEKLFEKAGIHNVKELLCYHPRTYDVYRPPILVSEIEESGVHALYVSIASDVEQKTVRKLTITTVFATDEKGGRIKLTWFNMPFLRTKLKYGYRYIVRGNVSFKGALTAMEQPVLYTMAEYELKLHSMQPIYSLVKGLTNNMISKAIRQCFALEDEINNLEYIPDDYMKKYDLMPLKDAVKYIHFPRSNEEMLKARERFVFDEFFTFLLKLNKLKSHNLKLENDFNIINHAETDRLISELPFKLTPPQLKAYGEIMSDISGKQVMNRLVQGDVGSGKTILAVLALVNTALSGYQGAMMVPTEVLANQHYEYMTKLFEEHRINVKPVLLIGSMTAARKRYVYQLIESGEADIVIGTHALIQDKAVYNNLALVVTDEQHRFGVNQRNNLAKKGLHPHVCVMSATPIPRTLAIILYGDLDISIIDVMPEGRKPIKNCVVDDSYRVNAYKFITNQVSQGHQAYVICPMVEESENYEAENVEDYTRMLREELKGLHIEGLHGKMSSDLKNEIMERFAKGITDVLVSTTVIEVGINVPNATVMLIENAERFGLAQLHQLRGRVGRGKDQSYCIFISTSKKKETKERLDIIGSSNDGFYIAEQDMKLRGPGDFFGIRQSGDMEFKLADIYADARILKKAKDCADYVLENHLEEEFKKAFIIDDFMLY